MKFISFALFIALAVQPAFSQNSGNESTLVSLSKSTFLTKMLAKPAIEDRCEKYEKSNLLKDLSKTFLDPLIQFNCEKATNDLFQILDIQTLSDEQGYLGRALFTQKLIEYISSEQSHKILLNIIKKFKAAESSSNKKFDLFQTLTLAPLNLTLDRAVEFIAVMFQDTNALQHIYYLELLKNKQNWDEKSLLNANLELLKYISYKFQAQFYDFHNLEKNRFFNQFNYYPRNQSDIWGPKTQPALYHFYTPAYLTQKLSEKNNSSYYAFMVPFSLRLIYEQLFNEEEAMSNLETYLIAIGQKEPPIKSTYKHVDLYLSLKGSSWALNKNLNISLTEFAQLLSNNLPKTLRLIAKNL
jgi:hypothetical protein